MRVDRYSCEAVHSSDNYLGGSSTLLSNKGCMTSCGADRILAKFGFVCLGLGPCVVRLRRLMIRKLLGELWRTEGSQAKSGVDLFIHRLPSTFIPPKEFLSWEDFRVTFCIQL